MKIYIASSWKNAEIVGDLSFTLRHEGHNVFDFTDPLSRPQGFDHFVFNANSLKEASTIDWVDFLSWDESKRAFRSDKAGLDWAEVVVLVLPCGRSSHLEAGYAIGQGKKVFVFGDLPKGEFDVMYGFFSGCFKSNQLKDLLKKLKEVPNSSQG